ncbi:uncharacterized protein LOC134535323 [Bacillus rossius redtenbacheri]|uniref:uncharacterized protein LOC134535323 n=1 Tax=Bacillus rossius redtenbacheri TaxID=93214 RepID=UPI002FDEF0D3
MKGSDPTPQTHKEVQWKELVAKEERAAEDWCRLYGWRLQENSNMREAERPVLEQLSALLADEAIPLPPKDDRKVPPVPATTAGDIGWLSTLEEFKLELYGSTSANAHYPLEPPE